MKPCAFWTVMLGLCTLLFAAWCSAAVTYTYDTMNRLTGVDYGTGTTIAYTYDAVGNITGKRVTSAGSGSNANLGNLTVSTGSLSPAFASGTSSYAVSVGNAVSGITITPTAADPAATIKVNGTTVASGSASGAINLNVGSNTITVVVTAQDGTTTRTYTITVTRAATLSAPGAPTNVSAAAGNGMVTVNFGPPASDGGSAITGYAATCTSSDGGASGSNTGGAAAVSIVVSGLTNGRSYTCTVTATNAIGTGSPSAASNSVTPSGGTGNIAVPNVVGLTEPAASAAIYAANLTLGTITTANSDTVPSGLVISQSPVANTAVAARTPVSFVVSIGPATPTSVVVPNVVGMTEPAASAAIYGSGLTLGTITTARSASVPSGSVISQSPAANATVPFRTAVSLVISIGPPIVVVEFYYAPLDHYFITADPNEQRAIDNGSAGAGWVRTGDTFLSDGSTTVCRFYGNANVNPTTGTIYGPNSHFYTIAGAECDGLIATFNPNAPSWHFESQDFRTSPVVNGQCTASQVPIYRAYNNGFNRGIDSNHRLTPNPSSIQQVVARGWISEGVVMCAPK